MPARTRVAATVKVQLDAGQANPGKVGQSLGHTGINIMAGGMRGFGTARIVGASRRGALGSTCRQSTSEECEHADRVDRDLR
jgi:hypothetical protein